MTAVAPTAKRKLTALGSPPVTDPFMTMFPKKPAPPLASAASPLLTACDLVPLGDGSYRAVPRRPSGKVTPKEAARLANYPLTSIYRLYRGGFVSGERQSPRRILIDVESLRAHLEAVRDPDYWTAERHDRYWNGEQK